MWLWVCQQYTHAILVCNRYRLYNIHYLSEGHLNMPYDASNIPITMNMFTEYALLYT